MSAQRIIALLLATLLSMPAAYGAASCPTTPATGDAPVDGWPDVTRWTGTSALATLLPEDGDWPLTAERNQIAVKLFWYASGFEAGMERDFSIVIERLDEGPNDARAMRPTNATMPSGVTTILTGIDFPSAGCWKITGVFREETLEFVVATRPN